MGIWFREPAVASDERVLFRATANRLINVGEMRGGRLVVTDRRVIFEPNRLDRLVGAEPWVVESHAIRDAVSAPGGKEGVAKFGLAGKRPHLALLADGVQPGVFAVRDTDGLRAAVDTSRGRPQAG